MANTSSAGSEAAPAARLGRRLVKYPSGGGLTSGYLGRPPLAVVTCVILTVALGSIALAAEGKTDEAHKKDADGPQWAEMLVGYYHQMSVPKPFVVRDPEQFKPHQAELRKKLLECTGLWPIPDRVPLDLHESEALDHPWCTVRRVYYQLWPDVYSSALIYMPKQRPEHPVPGMLCPHGHWKDGNAHPEVQKRCLNFARLGYVTFSSTQNHYEDLYLGVSHQTLMIWNNMRALDCLQSLPEVDGERIGVAGASGGGLQTQMLVALDPRVKAATIVGLTCDFREIMFPDRTHCTCNHFPGVMQFTDHPEISALALPAAVQFLTMNDWTKKFEHDNFPVIQQLYEANGLPDRVDCRYYDTPHSYDQQKRERTYWWMERWLRGKDDPSEIVTEPENTETFPVETLKNLSTEVAADKGFAEISRIYRQEKGYRRPALASPADWRHYKEQMLESLRGLLGLDATLPRAVGESQEFSQEIEGDLLVERAGYPSEGGIVVPTILLRPNEDKGKLPVALMLCEAGKNPLLATTGPGSPGQLAREGRLVVLPDVRCYGKLFSTGGENDKLQRRAWQRNGIVWGRPVPGMACTDIMGVLDSLSSRPDADMSQVTLISQNSGDLAVAGLFAAAMDSRITSIDVDLNHCCFEKRNLPLIPRVLQHGDVLEWAALVADRELTIRNVPPESGDIAWLQEVFAAIKNRGGLRVVGM